MLDKAKEPIGGQEGRFPPRRRWSDAEKRRIVAEGYQPGVSVSVVARRHDMNTNHLFTWRRQFRELAGDAGNGGFVPVVVGAARRPVRLRYGSAPEYRPLSRKRMVWRTTRVEPSLFSIKRLSFGHGLATPLAAAVVALSLVACSQSREPGSEGAGNEGSGEHGGMEGSGEHDGDGESSEGDGEESATQYGPGDTYDVVRAGARLVLRYDAAAQTFTGTVTNTTNATLSRVRVEVHLSNGVELGPTTPVDLAPGQAVDITLPAAGQTFATWSAHPEVGGPGGNARAQGSESDIQVAFTPSLGGWATIDGVRLGIEHQGHGLRAWYTLDGGVWTPHISPPAPQRQPTEAATWTGEWAGYSGDDPTINTGEARVTVTLGNGPKATLALDDVPTLGTLQWVDMSIGNGRFSGTLTTQNSGMYEAVGQFGGTNQAGVVGHASGSDLRSVFYGQKAD